MRTCACEPCDKEATDGNRCYVCAVNQEKGCRHCEVCGNNTSAFTPTGLLLHNSTHDKATFKRMDRSVRQYNSSFHRAEESYEHRMFNG